MKTDPDPRSRQSGPVEQTTGAGAEAAPKGAGRVRFLVTPDVAPAIADFLARAGFSVEPFQPDAVATALAGSSATCAVLWGDPAYRLAAAIRQGQSADQALEDWSVQASDLLAVFRRNRRNLLLVDARTLTAPDAGPEQDMLRRRLECPDLNLPHDVGGAHGDRETAGPGSKALAQVLIRLVIAQSEGIREVLEELQASGISPPVEGPRSAELSGAISEFVHLVATGEEVELLRTQAGLQMQELQDASGTMDRQRAELASAREEVELLRTQVGQHKQELQDAVGTMDRQRAELASAGEKIKRAEAAFRAQEKEHRDAMRDANRTLAQARSDLHDEAKARQELQSQCDMLTERVADLSAKLDTVFSSRSWRVTRPMRFVKGEITGERKSLDMLMAEERQKDTRQ